mgnify:CR=1 FL=1
MIFFCSKAESVSLLSSKNAEDQKRAVQQLKEKLYSSSQLKKESKESTETNIAKQLVCLLICESDLQYQLDIVDILIKLSATSSEVRVLLAKQDCLDQINLLKRKLKGSVKDSSNQLSAVNKRLICCLIEKINELIATIHKNC